MKVITKGLLFDMDGVLISSLGSVERSWQTWAERHGLDVRETIKTAHGMRAIETVRTLRPDADHDAELKVIEDLEVQRIGHVRIACRTVAENFRDAILGHTDGPGLREVAVEDLLEEGLFFRCRRGDCGPQFGGGS